MRHKLGSQQQHHQNKFRKSTNTVIHAHSFILMKLLKMNSAPYSWLDVALRGTAELFPSFELN